MATQGPNAEFSCEKRLELLKRLKEKLDASMPFGIPSPLWAGFWLADLENLEAIVQFAEAPSSRAAFRTDYGSIVRKWCQRDRSRSRSRSKSPSTSQRPSPTQPSSPLHRSAVERQARARLEAAEGEADQPASEPVIPSPPPAKRQCKNSDQRSKLVTERCRFRDRGRCVVTKYLDPIDACHIFPFSMRKSFIPGNTDYAFWDLLRYFWTNAQIDTWLAAAFPGGSTEVVENLICFALHVHRWHAKALFGLQPIHQSEDKKQLTVKFYWLPPRKPVNNVNLLDVPFIPDDLTGIDSDYKAWNVITEEKIVSGTTIVMETSDPENLPLPSWDLLELQWNLQRLTALSGAADVFPDAVDDDDSSGIEWGDDLSCDQSDDGDDSLHFHDDIASSDQDVEPLSLSPQVPKVSGMMGEVRDTPIYNESLA